MKTILCLLSVVVTFSLVAAEPATTNAPAAEKSPVGKIPDATHQPVFTTNTVTIAGQRVTYVAEPGMLPILKADGTSDRKSVV